MTLRRLLAALFVLMFAQCVRAQAVDDSDDVDTDEQDTLMQMQSFRFSAGLHVGLAGMYVPNYARWINHELAQDVESVSRIASAATFGSSFMWRFADDYDISINQCFLTSSDEYGGMVGPVRTFSYDVHEFALMVHRDIVEEYASASFGLGGGLIYAILHKSISDSPTSSRYSGTGGFLEIEGVLRTPFGGHLFLHTAVSAALTFTTEMLNAQHQDTNVSNNSSEFNAVHASVNVGLDYCF